MYKLLLILLFTTQGLQAKEALKLYVDTTMYFVSNDKPVEVKQISQMKKHYGGFNEIHSSHEWTLHPGGIWNIETRLNEENLFNIVFWIKDKNQPEINKNFDVSTLEMTTFTLLKTNKGKLKINIVPKIIKPELKPVKLGLSNFGLNHLCLKNSAVIIDDNYYMGKLSGFGERVEIRFPEFYSIDLSLKPLRDWTQIGTYLDGVIKIDVDKDHIFEMLNVGIGPSGMTKGGPFKVYGEIKPPIKTTREEFLAIEKEYVLNKLSLRLQNIIMKANKLNPYFSAGTTIGNDVDDVNKEHLYRTIGDFFEGFNCG